MGSALCLQVMVNSCIGRYQTQPTMYDASSAGGGFLPNSRPVHVGLTNSSTTDSIALPRCMVPKRKPRNWQALLEKHQLFFTGARVHSNDDPLPMIPCCAAWPLRVLSCRKKQMS